LEEGFWDKIFDTKIVTALGRALPYYYGSGVVKVFTAAVAQGPLHYFYRIFMPIYLQRGFGTGYLILRWLPHLEVR